LSAFCGHFFEFAVVENFAFEAKITIILTLEALGWTSEHERKILPVSE